MTPRCLYSAWDRRIFRYFACCALSFYLIYPHVRIHTSVLFHKKRNTFLYPTTKETIIIHITKLYFTFILHIYNRRFKTY